MSLHEFARRLCAADFFFVILFSDSFEFFIRRRSPCFFMEKKSPDVCTHGAQACRQETASIVEKFATKWDLCNVFETNELVIDSGFQNFCINHEVSSSPSAPRGTSPKSHKRKFLFTQQRQFKLKKFLSRFYDAICYLSGHFADSRHKPVHRDRRGDKVRACCVSFCC